MSVDIERTAEENRHGDLLNAYLRLTGRVNMRAVERTVHQLIANGFNPKSHADPYNLLVYTSFQERATRVSHGNVGRIAAREGDANLARICGIIAGDEARHEAFYARMMGLRDYASIIRHLVKAWNIAGRTVTGTAAQAQDELCRQAERYERLADRMAAMLEKEPSVAFRCFAIERCERG